MVEPILKHSGGRFRDMDLARSVILISGVFFHAAFLYSARESWYLSSPYKSGIFDALIAFVRTFRMESLFIVSGFFSAMLVTRSGSKGFVVNRFVRMGVPLLFCGLTFNTVMIYLAVDSKEPGWTFLGYLLSGRWRAHLWNVGNLLAYEAAVFTVLWIRPGIHHRLANSRLVPWLAIPAYLAIAMLAVRAWAWAPDAHWLAVLLHPRQMAMYVAAYLLGYVLHQNESLRDALFRPWRTGAAVLTLYLVRRWMGASVGLEGSPVVEAVDLLQHLARALFLFALVRKLQTDSLWVKRLSLASYSIYILHLPLQIALFPLVDSRFPNPVGFFLIGTISLLVAWAIHVLVVERIPSLGFLINGKVYRPDARSFPGRQPTNGRKSSSQGVDEEHVGAIPAGSQTSSTAELEERIPAIGP